MKLVRNWKKVLGQYSTAALSAVVAIPAIWYSVPPEIVAFIPADKVAVISAVVAGAGLVGKFISQEKPAERAVNSAVDEVKSDLVDTYLTKGKEAVIDQLKKAVK